jgi:hypothetical protein
MRTHSTGWPTRGEFIRWYRQGDSPHRFLPVLWYFPEGVSEVSFVFLNWRNR